MKVFNDSQSLESQIADCFWAIYSTTDRGVAMRHWDRLVELKSQKTAEQTAEFIREAKSSPGLGD